MLCLLVVFTLDEEALSRPSFCSSSTWPSFLDICLTSPTFALLSEYSCDLNVGFQSLVFARTRRCGRLSTAGRFAGDPGSAPTSELHYVSQTRVPSTTGSGPTAADVSLFLAWMGALPLPACRHRPQELLRSKVFLLPLPRGSLCTSQGSLPSTSKDIMRRSLDSTCSPSSLCTVSAGEVELQSSSPLANNF